MNILLVSQCDKRALKETRRIIDQFAERRGDRTWQTAITKDGLDTLRRLLRKTARKNTAVACHWIRGVDHTELLWIVGNRSQFNAQGATPTNTTQHDILRSRDENDWRTGEDIHLLAQMAALLHDLGKASISFQQRLQGQRLERNLYRHEWVSLRLFQAFVGKDDDAGWLARLADHASPSDMESWLGSGRYWRDGIDANAPLPFATLPPLAAAIGWLIVSHHRLPAAPAYTDDMTQLPIGRKAGWNVLQLQEALPSIHHGWNEVRQSSRLEDVAPYWECTDGLPVHLPKWRARAARLAQRLQTLCQRSSQQQRWLDNPYVMHLARLCLMLADHHYSSLEGKDSARVRGDAGCTSHANTDKQGHLKQPLDEHLLGVTRDAGRISHALPDFRQRLRHLRTPALRKRSGAGRFQWQDKAADMALGLRDQADLHGAFIINMASTGCGKTLANARIMYALADPEQGMRCAFALGLRTLTLQTGRSFRQDLRLDEEDLAVRVGGSASRALFAYHEAQAERTGSASAQDLIEEDSDVLYEGADDLAMHDGLLGIALKEQRIRSLLAAPILVCTIDHLMPATEAQRAGRQIAPMLRLLSGDVVLDELDDFDLSDLPALARLMYWIGMLGSRVLVSSATMPPALVQGMFEAYRHGRQIFAANRGPHAQAQPPLPDVACLWVDEFGSSALPCAETSAFMAQHMAFVDRRVKALRAAPVRRRGALLPLQLTAKPGSTAWYTEYAEQLQAAVVRAHQAHAETDPGTGRSVSFGVVRMANIEPLFHTARALFKMDAPAGYRIHLCVYHSRFPLLLRSAIEQQLDQTFNRRDPAAVYQLPAIREQLDAAPDCQHVFVVLASPVCEVGRDWCADWAIVEPSSMRSLIQLAGRVMRHRQKACETPNVLMFDTNLKHWRNPAQAAFVRPGFENQQQQLGEPHRLSSHNLHELLREDEYHILDARPRIQPRSAEELQPETSLVDLEHHRLTHTLLPKNRSAPASRRGPRPSRELDAACIWQIPQATLTWILPQELPFRKDEGAPEVTVLFMPEDGEEGPLLLRRIDERSGRWPREIYVREEDAQGNGRLQRIGLDLGDGMVPWGSHDLSELLGNLADHLGIAPSEAARQFTSTNVPQSPEGWLYHRTLGFAKK